MGQIQWWKDAVFHVTSNGKQQLFRDRLDYRVFLRLMALAQHQISYRLHAYSLMPTSFHIMVSTDRKDLTPLVTWIQRKYAEYYRNRYESSGSLFEGKFQRHLIKHRIDLLEASQCIHMTPVMEELAPHPLDYPWSSYAQYVGQSIQNKPNDLRLYTHRVLQSFEGQNTYDEKAILYKQFVERQLPVASKRSIHPASQSLTQLGSQRAQSRQNFSHYSHTL